MAEALKEEVGDIRIVVDSTESRSGIIKSLEASEGFDVEVTELLAGDYVVGDGVVVERKSATDFVLSILDRRIFSQVQLMKGHYGSPVVIVEGDIYKTRSRIASVALDGAISYLAVLEGVPIVPSKNAAHTAELLKTFARHSQKGLGYEVALRSQKPKDTRAISQYLVEGLPGVGAGNAKKLLDHFGSAKAVFEASVEQLCEVPGVGKGLAAKIRGAIDAEY